MKNTVAVFSNAISLSFFYFVKNFFENEKTH